MNSILRKKTTPPILCGCGGTIKFSPCGNPGLFKWDAHCDKCLTCDPNGWPTLERAMDEAKTYFATIEPDLESKKGT